MITKEKNIDNRFIIQLFESNSINRKFNFSVLIRMLGSDCIMPIQTNDRQTAERIYGDSVFILSKLKELNLRQLQALYLKRNTKKPSSKK